MMRLAARPTGGFASCSIRILPGRVVCPFDAPFMSAKSHARVSLGEPFINRRFYRKQQIEEATRQLYNPPPAIDYISQEPPREVDGKFVYCNGGNPALGHPQVFINLEKPGPHACGYCGIRYIRKKSLHHH